MVAGFTARCIYCAVSSPASSRVPPTPGCSHRCLPAWQTLSLCPRCHPQISVKHKFRLFHVLETVISSSNALDESWEKTFMQLALENMTKSTVGPPAPPPANRLPHKGSGERRQLPGDPDVPK